MAWQPLKPELVVEVRYDQVTGPSLSARDRASYAGALTRTPKQCTFLQLAPELRPSELRELFDT